MTEFSGATLPNSTTFRGSGGAEGGELHLAKPAAGSSLGGNVAIDVIFDTFRIFDSATGRGYVLDMREAQGQARLWHSESDLTLRAYAPGALPTPAIGRGTLAYLAEAPPSIVYSDGQRWRRMHDRSVV